MIPACKTLRLRKEWDELKKKNPKFYVMLSQIFSKMWPTVPIITNLFRKQAEQDGIYHANLKYRMRPWKSVHQYWRGCDVTVHNLTKAEIEDLEKNVNLVYPYGKKGIRTMIAHDVGRGNHIHLQIKAG